MFDELHKSTKRTVGSGIGLSRSSSKDSVGTVEQQESGKRKTEHIKRLETKLSEFGQIIRDKNAKLDEVNKQLEKFKHAHEVEVSALRAECASLRDSVTLQQTVKMPNERSLLPMEREINSYREQMASQMNELEQCRQQLTQLHQEHAANQHMLEKLRQEKAELQDLCRVHRTQLSRITSERDDFERTVECLRVQLSSVTEERDQLASDAMQRSGAIQDSNVLDSKSNSTQAQFETREAILQDKLNNLEDRLRILSSTSFSPLSTPLNEGALAETSNSVTSTEDVASLSEENSGVVTASSLTDDPAGVPLTSAAGDVMPTAAQFTTLLRERNLLISRLETIRIHLTEAKTQWNDCVIALKRQIVHLNSKIEEDSVERRRTELSHQSLVKSLKLELTETHEKLAQAMNLVQVTEKPSTEKVLASESQTTDWSDERAQLIAELSSLSTQAERTTRERDEALQELMLLRTQEQHLQNQLKLRSDVLTQCEQELLQLRAQYQSKGSELQDVERTSCLEIRRSPELRKQVSQLSMEHNHVSTDVRASEATENGRIDFNSILAQKDQVIKLQQKRMKEMRRMLVEHLKSHPVPSDQDSVDGLVTGWYPYSSEATNRSQSFERVSIGSSHSWPPVPFQVSNNTARCTEENGSQFGDHSPLTGFNRSPSGIPTQTIQPTSTSAVGLASAQSNNPTVPPEVVNFRYLRHVIIKFLLSRENEALQLVRVLSTLLYLTAEEEKLLRQSLTKRRSWLKGKPAISPSKAHGQFAKIIPPPS